LTMAAVFGEQGQRLSDQYVENLLRREDMWILAATLKDEIVGGLTAHSLPMTRTESREILIYDLAVLPKHQRCGVGSLLVSHLREIARAAEIHDLFVPADDEDAHALDFYRALGGVASAVTIFTFG
jgi:aminoglycoside 3-N-acetyltransferase I